MIEDIDKEIWVANRGGALLLPVAEVLYFMAEAKYVTAVTSRVSYKFEDSLDSLGKRLGNTFIRSHRKYLVRVSAIRSIVTIGVSKYFEIPDILDPIPVSRREEALVREVLKARTI